jgi:hypothetical protein
VKLKLAFLTAVAAVILTRRSRQTLISQGTTSDDVVKIAYEAISSSLEHDTSTTESLRSRATAVLSAATVMTAFVIGLDYHVGKSNSPLSFPTWAVFSLTAVLAIISICSVRILWPIHEFAYGPSSEKILAKLDAHSSPIASLRDITTACQTSHKSNLGKLKGRYILFQVSEAMLIAEVGILIAVLWSAR